MVETREKNKTAHPGQLVVLKQYPTLRSGTATPTHLLGGVHRGDDSGSWSRAVILYQ